MKTSEILNLTEEEKEKINDEFCDACLDGDLQKAKEILKGYCKVDYGDNRAIRWASMRGHIEIVKLLLEHEKVNPTDRDNEAISWANSYNHKEIVRLLLQDERVRNSLSKKGFEILSKV